MVRRRFQYGALFKRGAKHKVWVGRWWENTIGPDGRVRRIRRAGVIGTVTELPTRRSAEQVLIKELQAINNGNYHTRANCTFIEFVQKTWMPEVLPTVKFSTQNHYRYIVRVHLEPVFGSTQLRLISREAVQQFLQSKLQSGLAWKTVRHLRTVFGTIMNDAEQRDLIERNPVRKTRLPRRPLAIEKPAIVPEQIRVLLEALPEPSRSIAWLLVFTGLRVGEILALRWSDVDLVNQFIRVRQTVYEGHFDEPKSARSKRAIPIGPVAIGILTNRKPVDALPNALVFSTGAGASLSRRNLLKRQLQPTAKNTGLAGINWHWLRHANATLHDSVGTPLGTVQALLGHSSSEITREIYIHSVPADARKAVENVEHLLIGPKWTQIVEIQNSGSAVIQ